MMIWMGCGQSDSMRRRWTYIAERSLLFLDRGNFACVPSKHDNIVLGKVDPHIIEFLLAF
jgi:hypothetical protein